MSKTKPAAATNNSIHFTLQGKGGVGKSFASAVLTQYFKNQENLTVKAIDTDPVNQTLMAYKALNAEHIKLLDGSKIDERNFDLLMEKLLSEEGVFIVDNGASSFVALSNYIVENDAINMLEDARRNVYVHCVIAGGQALVPTMDGFKALAEQPAIKNIVVWLNEYFGEIEYQGKQFTDMKTYLNHANKVRGIVKISKRNQDTFGKDVQLMSSNNLTFNEAIQAPEFSLMAKQRIKTVQRDLYTQLDNIGF